MSCACHVVSGGPALSTVGVSTMVRSSSKPPVCTRRCRSSHRLSLFRVTATQPRHSTTSSSRGRARAAPAKCAWSSQRPESSGERASVDVVAAAALPTTKLATAAGAGDSMAGCGTHAASAAQEAISAAP